MRCGIYPGTFDPVTRGHHEIIRRGSNLVDQLIIAVSISENKQPTLSVEERCQLLEADLADYNVAMRKKLKITILDGLLVNHAKQHDAKIILRGLRAISDFEFEVQMAGLNYHLDPSIETIFLSSTEQHQFVSSRFVREIARLGGDVSPFVTPNVFRFLKKKYPIPASKLAANRDCNP